MARQVHVVPHTHWDREWYRSFQSFRLKLVELVDELLDRLEADPGFTHFLLDGQMSVVDDYLAIRPENTERLRALAAAGRISMGPWYILMDEFLVSGETIIRDLELGRQKAAAFGGAMALGYLPDMFGHIAQMPQLLAGFGLEHAVVWRGVPSAVDAEAFRWEAPDGTAVRAEFLSTGYSNGAVLLDDAKDLVLRVQQFADQQGSLAGDTILWMNGTDHLPPRSFLPRVLAEANSITDDLHFSITSLAEHVVSGRTEGLPAWRGEMRSGARSNLLMGVASNRVDVHQAEARTVRALERCAEPLSALYLPGDVWPATFLAEAWLQVIHNAAHDSICACSVDEVGRAVIHRFDEATGLADGLTRRAVAAVARSVGGTEPLVVNPSARRRSDVVTLDLPGTEPVGGTQVLSVRHEQEVVRRPDADQALAVVQSEVEQDPSVHRAEIEREPGTGITVTLFADSPQIRPAMAGPIVEELAAVLAAAEPDTVVTVVKVRPPQQQVLARVADVPGFGWKRANEFDTELTPVRAGAGGQSLTNGLITVAADPSEGTWSIDGHDGLGRLVDDGDSGDTYNYNPPTEDAIIDRPDSVTVTVLDRGPVAARLRIDAAYTWPERVEGARRVGAVTTAVVTTLELRAGERLARATVELDNRSRDHRLRAWFPLPQRDDRSRAECAFTVVERGLTAEGGPTELGLPTFPSRRFVQAGGLTVAHEGLLEYELVDLDPGGATAGALALTLLRCTGLISEGPMAHRPTPAGPRIATDDAQMPGRQRLRYAIALGEDVDPYQVADDAFLPLLVARPGGGPATSEADEGTPLTVTGAEVSSVRRHHRQGRLEVRVFNPTDQAATVTVDGRRGYLVDLAGQALGHFEQTFDLRPHGIATISLDD